MNESTIGLGPYSGPHRCQCSVEEFGEKCGEKVYSLGLCHRHYVRYKRHKNPLICIANKDRKSVKLDETKVREIRRLYKSGATQRSIARDFNVTRSAVQKVTQRKNWRGVA